MNLTPRMKNWIEGLGVHVAVATRQGFPTVLVALKCQVDGDTVKVLLTAAQVKQVEDIISENSRVALAPGQLGSVRAPYQFKGKGSLRGESLVVAVDEIYCTKPGAEAGIRLDTMGYEAMKEYDESRWKDLEPPRAG